MIILFTNKNAIEGIILRYKAIFQVFSRNLKSISDYFYLFPLTVSDTVV